MRLSLVGSEMCIRDRKNMSSGYFHGMRPKVSFPYDKIQKPHYICRPEPPSTIFAVVRDTARRRPRQKRAAVRRTVSQHATPPCAAGSGPHPPFRIRRRRKGTHRAQTRCSHDRRQREKNVEHMRNISNIKGVLYAVVSSATFGLIPLFSIPLLHAGMASPTILFYRMLLSAAIMAAVALLLKRNFRISRRDFGVLAGLSLMYAATSLGLLRSYDYIPSGVATTVNFLYPLVVTIVMTLFFRERSSVWIVIAVFISLVGVALLAWGDAGNNDPGRGLIYAGTTVFTYAVYIIGVMKSRAGRLDPLIVAFYVLTFSAAVFLVYALSTSGIAVVHTWHIWRNLLLLALLPTVLSNLTLVLAIKHIGSTMTSILGSMEPLTAVLVGVVHFGERFDLDSAAGLILVVTAVIIVILQNNPTPQTPPANIPPTQPPE